MSFITKLDGPFVKLLYLDTSTGNASTIQCQALMRYNENQVLFAPDAFTGTFIDQGEAPDFYYQKYPEDNPVLGFFTWRWVLTLGFDHMFSSPIFLGTLVLLGASLMACTYTTQIPMVKIARRLIELFCHIRIFCGQE